MNSARVEEELFIPSSNNLSILFHFRFPLMKPPCDGADCETQQTKLHSYRRRSRLQILCAGTEWKMGCNSKARQKVACEGRWRKRTRRRRRKRMGDRQTQQAFTASLDTGESRGAITSAQRLLVLTIPLLIPPLISPLVPSLSFGW